MKPRGVYSHTRIVESVPPLPEHVSINAGPIRGRATGSGATIVIVCLLVLVGWVIWVFRPQPASDAAQAAESRARIAAQALEREKAEHLALREDYRAIVARVNRLEDDLRNAVAQAQLRSK